MRLQMMSVRTENDSQEGQYSRSLLIQTSILQENIRSKVIFPQTLTPYLQSSSSIIIQELTQIQHSQDSDILTIIMVLHSDSQDMSS